MVYWITMTPVTETGLLHLAVCIPDLLIRSVRVRKNWIFAEYERGPAPRREAKGKLTDEVLRHKLALGAELFFSPVGVATLNTLEVTLRIPKRQLPKEALNEFLRLASPNEAGAFVQKYGDFSCGRSRKERQRRRGLPKRMLAYRYEEFLAEKERLAGLLRMWAFVREGTEKCMEQAKAAGKALEIHYAVDPHYALSFHLSERLFGGAWVAMIAKADRLEPILFCRDVLTGLYAILFKEVVAGSPWSSCLRCSTAFRAQRPDKRFCSERCQQYYKQLRYRQEKKRRIGRTSKRSRRRRR